MRAHGKQAEWFQGRGTRLGRFHRELENGKLEEAHGECGTLSRALTHNTFFERSKGSTEWLPFVAVSVQFFADQKDRGSTGDRAIYQWNLEGTDGQIATLSKKSLSEKSIDTKCKRSSHDTRDGEAEEKKKSSGGGERLMRARELPQPEEGAARFLVGISGSSFLLSPSRGCTTELPKKNMKRESKVHNEPATTHAANQRNCGKTRFTQQEVP